AGAFQAGEDQEANSYEIRSVATMKNEGDAVWVVKWRAPQKLPEALTIDVAVNAGNDDQSPFGDDIHYRSFTLEFD
ncbi:MAG: hypothetical protein ACX939_12850, partial [Hyphococcus sp.]